MKNKRFQSFTAIVLIALTAAFCLSDSARAGASGLGLRLLRTGEQYPNG